MAYLAIVSITAGRRCGFAAIAGIALGLATIGTLAALGLATLINESPYLLQGLTWIGAAYLLWLAWGTWHDNEPPMNDAALISPGALRYCMRGFITNLLNPKAFLFYATLLPGFLGDQSPSLHHTGVLTLIYVAIATLIHIIIVTMASRFSSYLLEPHRQRLLRRIMSLLLVAITFWFVISNTELTMD